MKELHRNTNPYDILFRAYVRNGMCAANILNINFLNPLVLAPRHSPKWKIFVKIFFVTVGTDIRDG